MTGTASERKVGGGLWWNGGTWTLRSVPEAGGALPDTGGSWRRVPAWLLLPLAPVVGGAFVVALPIVGAVMVAKAVAAMVLASGGQAAKDLAATVAAPAARPGEAHLTGASPEEAGEQAGGAPTPPGESGPTEPLDEVDADVRARRTPPAPR